MLKIQARPEDGEPMRTRRVGAMLTALLLAMGLALTVASPAGATFPGGNGLVLFTRGGNLYTATSSGGSIKQLTTTADIAGPKWSPSGASIVYRRGTTIYIRTYPAGKVTTVTTGANGNPQWSPDGTKIAYIASIPGGDCGQQGIYTVPIAGGVPTLASNFGATEDICNNGPSDYYGLGTYTADGRELISSCNYYRDSGCAIDIVTMDGTNQFTNVTTIFCNEESLDTDSCNPELHLSDARLTAGGSGVLFDGRGGYEPEGAGTLPGSTPYPTTSTPERVYAIDLAGTNLHSVSTAATGYNPTRSPYGSIVLFTQKAGSTTNLMKSGTTATSAATVFIKNASQADWQPTH